MKSNVVEKQQVGDEIVEGDERFDVRGLDTGHVSADLLLTPQDEEALKHFDELSAVTQEFADALQEIELSLAATEQHGLQTRLREMQQMLRTRFRTLLQQVFAHDVSAMQQIYDLRVERNRILFELDRLGQIAHLNLRQKARFYLRQIGPLRKAYRIFKGVPAQAINDPIEEEGKIRSIAEEHKHYDLHNPYADVDNRKTAFEIFRNWVTIFHVDGKRFGSSNPLVSDRLNTIEELHAMYPLQGKNILELGPLEAGNTKQMLDYGAGFVTGIESNRESFIKCLIAQNAIPLENTRFIYGDLNDVLQQPEYADSPKFDLCVASGLLYHMEDPLHAIDLIVQTAPVVYVWTHVASVRAPAGDWITVSDSAGRSYQGRKNEYKSTDCLGGVGSCAIWLTPEDMRRAFVDRGYDVEDVGDLQNYKGDAIKFIATKRK